MFIAGEASGDAHGAALAPLLHRELDLAPGGSPDQQPLGASLRPRFFGAGGPRMKAAGIELELDLTAHSVIGVSDVFRQYFKFRRFFHQLFKLAVDRQPELVVCIDFSGFNRRFVRAIRQHTRSGSTSFTNWQPRIVQYISPQVWASRAGRANQMARDYDLLLSIFPFEQPWYAERVPGFRVEFIGHPMVEWYKDTPRRDHRIPGHPPLVLLLPGSRTDELRRHLPVMIGALGLIRAAMPEVRARMVLPRESLAQQARTERLPSNLEVRTGGLVDSLREADVALASTGTVTLECAWFGLPTVALYKTSWSTYEIGKRIVKVNHLAMPNILAGEVLFPEFIQHAATPENVSTAALSLLTDLARRQHVISRLEEIRSHLGTPGASLRAAHAIASLLDAPPGRPAHSRD